MPHIKTKFLEALALMTFATIALHRCKKPAPAEPLPTEGKVDLQFDHKWGPSDAPFAMNTALTHPAGYRRNYDFHNAKILYFQR